MQKSCNPKSLKERKLINCAVRFKVSGDLGGSEMFWQDWQWTETLNLTVWVKNQQRRNPQTGLDPQTSDILQET